MVMPDPIRRWERFTYDPAIETCTIETDARSSRVGPLGRVPWLTVLTSTTVACGLFAALALIAERWGWSTAAAACVALLAAVVGVLSAAAGLFFEVGREEGLVR